MNPFLIAPAPDFADPPDDTMLNLVRKVVFVIPIDAVRNNRYSQISHMQ